MAEVQRARSTGVLTTAMVSTPAALSAGWTLASRTTWRRQNGQCRPW
jgi:hypothetical protein